MIVVIPALEPGPALPQIVRELAASDPDVDVLIVDDGSGPAYASVFRACRQAGARVLHHPANRGKGAALKTAFADVLSTRPGEDVVTADADGQHRIADILRVADGLREDAASETRAMILGCRAFTGAVPARSRVGNAASRGLFRLAAGWRLSDTQTGLRGLPASVLAWLLEVPGDRFEYEQNVLLRAHRAGVATREIPIETVYLDDNASSHFRPVADSLRVVLPLVLFGGSSLLAFFIDTLALLAMTALTGSLVLSIVVARLVSASVNFLVNRRVVFGRRGAGRWRQAVRYALLAGLLLASNIVWMQALTTFGVPLLAAKIATEAVLFVTSYGVQRSLVFGRPELESPSKARHRNRIGAPTRMESHPLHTGRSS
ncbi:bifunctional glycosyltransferase family 2/GtrA family protein [Microbacterium thalassium]|uniref:Glycosyltransferase involved in cell wall biosynthesis n=1 Tax=Microbacterium thalassium TaxID=362649 RepID=A0A7X0KVT2_9MICO|nr:bifunctional glycosyltransferase family 2/GtrA family protein [Microbacterium thalassium]MBB6392523.1 glycosyltransferase involved in cell wall biosynthesis [Microbacterium thalassium]GLK23246.1 polysaccharide synthesis protein GtrA [Microbacterium thalassium]